MFCSRCGSYTTPDPSDLCGKCRRETNDSLATQVNPKLLKQAVFTYFFLFVTGAVLFGALSGFAYGLFHPDVAIDPLNPSDSYMNFVSTLSNFFTYLLVTTVIALMLKTYLVRDWKEAIKNKAKTFLNGFGGWIVVLASAVVAGLIMEALGTPQDSSNQAEIVAIITGEFGFLMIFVTIIAAPIVEELIFRKAIIDGLERSTKLKLPVILLISSLLFASIHIVSEVANLFGEDVTFLEGALGLLQILPFLFMGVALGLVYKYSKNNVIVPIIAHVFQNAFATIMVFVGPELLQSENISAWILTLFR